MTIIQDLQRIARKGPPGPPPRPGLVWHEETSRWRRPEDMSEDDAQEAQEQMPEQQKQPQQQVQPQQPVEPKPLPPPRPLTIEETHVKANEVFDGALEELSNMFPEYGVKGRTKDLHSIKNKLAKYIRRSPERRWVPEKLPDLMGFRIETNSMEDVYEAVDALRQTYKVKQEKDYNRQPLDYYRSLHFLTEINGVGTEIQVRSPGQTKLADWTHDSFYKSDGSLPEEVLESGKSYARQMSSYLAGEADIMPDCPPDVVRYLGACLS